MKTVVAAVLFLFLFPCVVHGAGEKPGFLPAVSLMLLNTPVCEARGSGHCYYIAPWGDDSASGTFAKPFASTNPVLESLVAGDFLYFRGGHYSSRNRGQIVDYTTLPQRYSMGYLKNLNGTPDNPITLKAYPGEKPVIDLYELNPEFEPTSLTDEPRDAFCVYHSSYVRISGFEIVHGSIHLVNNPHHIWIENNHIHDLLTNRSNNGLILLHFAQNVFITGNRLHDTYERSIPDGEGGWKFNDEKSHYDAQHNGCITTLSGDIYVGYGNETSGPFTISDNLLYDCPAKLFIKNPQGSSVDVDGHNMVVENNYFSGAGYLVYGLQSSHTLFQNNLCRDNCRVNRLGSDEYPNGESDDAMINEIAARDITFRRNVFIDTDSFADIVGLGFGINQGIYSSDMEDKLKFLGNVVFMTEAAEPGTLGWNERGFLFSNSYAGQVDGQIAPSKILSRIVSRDNCVVNSRGETMAYLKQFVTDGEGTYQIYGYSHAQAVSTYGIDGTGDTFPVNSDPALYFRNPDDGDFALLPDGGCVGGNVGLTDPARLRKLVLEK